MFCSPCGVVCEPDSFFCHACGCTVNVTEGSRNDIDDIITYYFYRGYQYSAIVGLLKKHQGAQILEREEPGGWQEEITFPLGQISHGTLTVQIVNIFMLHTCNIKLQGRWEAIYAFSGVCDTMLQVGKTTKCDRHNGKTVNPLPHSNGETCPLGHAWYCLYSNLFSQLGKTKSRTPKKADC